MAEEQHASMLTALDAGLPLAETKLRAIAFRQDLGKEAGGFLTQKELTEVFEANPNTPLDHVRRLFRMLKTKTPKEFEMFCKILKLENNCKCIVEKMNESYCTKESELNFVENHFGDKRSSEEDPVNNLDSGISKGTYRQKQFGQSSSVSRRNPNKQSPNDMDASKQSKAEDPIDQKETYQQKQFGQSSSVSRRNPNKQPPNDMDASKQSKAEDPIDQKGTYQQKQFGQSSSVSRRNPNTQSPNVLKDQMFILGLPNCLLDHMDNAYDFCQLMKIPKHRWNIIRAPHNDKEDYKCIAVLEDYLVNEKKSENDAYCALKRELHSHPELCKAIDTLWERIQSYELPAPGQLLGEFFLPKFTLSGTLDEGFVRMLSESDCVCAKHFEVMRLLGLNASERDVCIQKAATAENRFQLCLKYSIRKYVDKNTGNISYLYILQMLNYLHINLEPFFEYLSINFEEFLKDRLMTIVLKVAHKERSCTFGSNDQDDRNRAWDALIASHRSSLLHELNRGKIQAPCDAAIDRVLRLFINPTDIFYLLYGDNLDVHKVFAHLGTTPQNIFAFKPGRYVAKENFPAEVTCVFEVLVCESFQGEATRSRYVDPEMTGADAHYKRHRELTRGHLAACGNYSNSKIARQDVFDHSSNILPMVKSLFNEPRGAWNTVEAYGRYLVDTHEMIFVFTGPIYEIRSEGRKKYMKGSTIPFPDKYFKIYGYFSEVETVHVEAFMIPNDEETLREQCEEHQCEANVLPQYYLCDYKEIEKLTHFRFFGTYNVNPVSTIDWQKFLSEHFSKSHAK